MPLRNTPAVLQSRARLEALRSTDLYRPVPDEVFDRLTRLASRVVSAPVVLLTLVDGERALYKSVFGLPEPLPAREIPLSQSVCRALAETGGPLLLASLDDPDAARRFPSLARLGLAACLGVPLETAGGELLGGLCVFDRVARSWSEGELEVARDLAAAAVEEVERRLEWLRAQEALRSSEQRFRSLIESAADLVTVLTAGGTVDYVTPSVTRMLGYAPEKLVGTNAFSIVHPESAAEVVGGFAGVIREASCDATLEFRVRHQDGSWRTLEARASNLLHDPAVGGVVVSARDVTDERLAEQSQRRLNAFLEATPDFVAIFDPHGRALSINRAFRSVSGIAEDDSLATVNLSDLFPHRVLEEILHEGIPTAIRDGVWFGETSLQGPDGEIPISQVIIAHKSAGGAVEFLSTLGRDITERKEAEVALRRSEEHFRALIENSADIIAVIDAEGMIRYESPSVERVLGYRPEALNGRPISDLVHPADRPESVQAFIDHIAGWGENGTTRVRVRHKDGSWRHFELSAQNLLDDPAVAGIVINSRDITERTQAEEAVRRSEARVRAIFDGAAIGIALSDLEGRILQANPALQEMLGYDDAELRERNLCGVIHPEDVPANQALFRDLVHGKQEHYQTEQRYLRREGSIMHGRLTVSLIRGAAGAPQFVVGMVEDVTDQRRTEEALRDSQEQLLQSQKMEAVGRLAGGVAHDFNNLLTAIKGFTELLLLDFDERDPRRSFASEIQAAANRAAGLTRQLLAFSRKQVLQPKVLDLDSSVLDMEKMLRRLIGEDVELVVDDVRSRGRVKADPGQIEQVLLNLVVNARDAMPGGGRLTLETADVLLSEGELPRHWNIRPGAYVRLSVSDSGSGMSKEVQERIFEPFFTTKEQGKGTGLGLSTVYGIVKQSGGYISVESQPGRGTTFRVYLPRVEEAVEERVVRTSGGPVAGNESILVVEDEAAVRVLIRRVLSRNGYRVMEAESGAAALALLERRSEPIDLLLTDVVMPGMSGRELADQLTARFTDLRVLYMSGYTDEAIVHHGVLDPGVAFLEKPFTPEVLLRRLREVLGAPVDAATS